MRQTLAAFAADHYVQRLDLGTDPFAEGFRSDYFYSGGQRKQVLDQALHFTRFSDQVVMLLGSTGSGTSAVLDQLLDQLESVMDFCAIDAESIGTPAHILTTLSSQLQFSNIDSVTSFIAALRYNAEMEPGAEPVLVAVDQAHFLGIESLELLRQLYEQAGGALHLLLVGEYQVEQLSKLAGFDGARLKLLELEPLTLAETADYVLGLLRSVGYAGEQPLSSDQLSVLHEQSGGNIAELNLLMPAILSAEPKTIGSGLNLSIPVAHLAAIIVLVVAIGLSYWYQGSDTADSEPLAAGSLASDSAAEPQAYPPVQKVQEAPQNESIVSAATQQGREQSRVPIEEIAQAAEPAAAAEPVIEKVAAATKNPQTPPANKSSPEQASAVVAAPPVEEKPDMDMSGQAGVVERVAQAEPATPVQKQVAPEEGARSKASATDVAHKPASPVVQPKSTAGTVSQEKPQNAQIPAREQRLLNLNDSAFMLQLMGSVDEKRTREFVKAYVGRLSLTYYETRRQQKPWFVVVTGPYDTKELARAGVGVLPQKLQRQQPWVRSVESVKKEIRNKDP